MKKITCTNNYTCSIYLAEHEKTKVLVIDFNIKFYQICNNTWNRQAFPPDILVHDKIYLDKALAQSVISVLEHFIKYESTDWAQTTRTNRGFNLKELKDICGNTISIQESSSALKSKIWFGRDTADKAYIRQEGHLVPYEYPPGPVFLEDRLHLDVDGARELVETINFYLALMERNALNTVLEASPVRCSLNKL